MFETCMVESAGQLKSTNTKWTTAGAFALEGTLLALVVIATMVHTDTINAMRTVRFVPPYSAQRFQTELVPSSGARSSGSNPFVAPREIPREIASGSGGRTVVIGTGDDIGPLAPNLPPGAGPAPNLWRDGIVPNVPIETPKRLIVSRMDPAKLLQQIDPPYPPLAKQAGVQGTVMLHAIINRSGAIESLQVISGHPMLVNAAVDAVRRWRYKPTYLGGQPVEVETTITVNFRLTGR